MADSKRPTLSVEQREERPLAALGGRVLAGQEGRTAGEALRNEPFEVRGWVRGVLPPRPCRQSIGGPLP